MSLLHNSPKPLSFFTFFLPPTPIPSVWRWKPTFALCRQALLSIRTKIFVMVRIIVEEPITPIEAFAQKILNSTEIRFVSSVTKIGRGGFGDIYKICLKRFVTDQELKGSCWEGQGHIRKVFFLLYEPSLTHLSRLQERLSRPQTRRKGETIRMKWRL